VLKKSDIPAVASYRIGDDDRELIWLLVQRRDPKNLTILLRDGLKALLEREKQKE